MSINLKEIPPKNAFSLIGGAIAVVTGLRDLRRSGKGGLETVHALLKIGVAVVGVVVALKAADAEADEAS